MPDVRTTSVDMKHKSYKNRMTSKKFQETYQSLVDQAVYWRARLLNEKRDVLVKFLEEYKKN